MQQEAVVDVEAVLATDALLVALRASMALVKKVRMYMNVW